MFYVKLTSQRTGAVCYLTSRGTPAARFEAGRWPTADAALAAFAPMRDDLTRVVGRCAWSPTVVAA